jgi:hypothetical protein
MADREGREYAAGGALASASAAWASAELDYA